MSVSNGTSTIMTDAAVGLPHQSGISSSSSPPSSSSDHSGDTNHLNNGDSSSDININIKSGGGGSGDHTATLNGKTDCSNNGNSEGNSDMSKMKTPNGFKKTLANSKSTSLNGDPVLHCGFNIISVTGIVFVNKLVFATGFKFPVTLTFFHIVMTAIGMRIFR